MDEEDEDYAGEAFHDYKRNNMRFVKYGLSGGADNSISHPFRLTCLEANAKKPFPYPVPDHMYIAPLSSALTLGRYTGILAEISVFYLKRYDKCEKLPDIVMRTICSQEGP